MKKCMKIIFIILVIISLLNIATINVNGAYTFSEIAGMRPEQLKKLSDEELKNYKESIEKSIEHVPSNQRETLNQALEKLTEELEGRSGYQGYTPSSPINNTKVTSMAGTILRIVRNVGVVLAIIALTIIGIKYMVGSVEQRAEYKKSMIPFVIGVIILASSTTFVSIIYDTTTNAFEEKETVSFDETLQSGEDAAREFLSMGPSKQQIYSELASASKKREDAYYTSYFKVLINAMPSNFKDGYNKGTTEIKDVYTQGLALKSCKENFDKATDTNKKEYYAGYLLALGDTYGLIELARVY